MLKLLSFIKKLRKEVYILQPKRFTNLENNILCVIYKKNYMIFNRCLVYGMKKLIHG